MADIRSILTVDFGSVYTRVALIDIVDGRYQLIARAEGRSSDGFPANNLQVGLVRIVRNLSETTGRQLMDQTNRIITPEKAGVGVDMFAVTASLGRPLRGVVVGLVPDVSIASAIRATNSTYIDVQAVVSLDDGRTEEDRLNAILLNYPDLILLTGGTEAGAERAIIRNTELVRLAVSLTNSARRPLVVYSGNSQLAETVEDMLKDVATVFLADNVRPSLESETLDSARLELGHAFDNYKERRHHSLAAIGQMSQTGVMPTAQGHLLAAEFLGKSSGESVAVLDIGSAATTLGLWLDGRLYSSLRTDIGLGHSAPQLVERTASEMIERWLPLYPQPSEIKNYAMNKSLRPASIPSSVRELYIEHALLRAGGRSAVAEASPDFADEPLKLDRIIASGSALTGTGSPGFNAMLMLDCMQPEGITQLESDVAGIIPSVSALASNIPEAVVHLLSGANLNQMGIAVSVSGVPRIDKPALKVTIVPENEDEPIVENEVLGGHLWVHPLRIGARATIKIRCLGGLRINGKRRLQIQAVGGTVGIIFDARGRPLVTGDDIRLRAAMLTLWVSEATGSPLHDVEANWLEKAKTTTVEEAADETGGKRRRRKERPKRERRGRRGRRNDVAAEADETVDEDINLEDLLAEDDEQEQDDLGALRDVLS